jgi:signal transduction histidine kinase
MPICNLSLATPFVVLALVIAGFMSTPLWIQRHSAQLRDPASAALASSVHDLGELVEMRTQLHRGIVARAEDGDVADQEGALRDLRAAFTRYAAAQSAPPAELAAAVGRFERDAPGMDVRQAQRSAGGLSNLLMDELAAGTRRAGAASERLAEIRGRSLRLVNALNFLWASLALVGGVVAAILVRRHQRVVERLRHIEQARVSELEQFAGRVAHDVLSPLGPVSPGLQVLSRKLDGDSAAQRAVGAIRRSLDRVSMIVDELLRFARSGAQPAPGERADIARVLESVRDELALDAEQSGVTLRFEPAPQVEVACAEGAMLVVIHNLVRNAIKYIGDGPRRLVVTRAVVAAQSVRLSVQDSGPGLPPGMEQAVFAPYVRAPGTHVPGIGLGLATVKRIVESRRGRVGVWSEPRKGATFWVDLPLASAPLSDLRASST